MIWAISTKAAFMTARQDGFSALRLAGASRVRKRGMNFPQAGIVISGHWLTETAEISVGRPTIEKSGSIKCAPKIEVTPMKFSGKALQRSALLRFLPKLLTVTCIVTERTRPT